MDQTQAFAILPARLLRLRGADLSVYAALCLHADRDGYCWPSRRRLVELTGYSERAVTTALAHLEEIGEVTREERVMEDGSQRSNLYRVLAVAQLGSDSPPGGGGLHVPPGGSPLHPPMQPTAPRTNQRTNQGKPSPPAEPDGAELALIDQPEEKLPTGADLVKAWIDGFGKAPSQAALGRVKAAAKRYGAEAGEDLRLWRETWVLFRQAGQAGVMDVPTYETSRGRSPVRQREDPLGGASLSQLRQAVTEGGQHELG